MTNKIKPFIKILIFGRNSPRCKILRSHMGLNPDLAEIWTSKYGARIGAYNA